MLCFVLVVGSRRHPNLLSHVVRAHIRPSILFEKSKSGWKGGREGKGENTKNGAFFEKICLPRNRPSFERETDAFFVFTELRIPTVRKAGR